MKENPCQYIGIAEKAVCQGAQHFESFFQDVIDKGGEGIILRDPYALLQPGRTTSYLKHKVLYIFISISLSLSHSTSLQLTNNCDPHNRNIAMLKQELLVILQSNGNANCKWNSVFPFLFLTHIPPLPFPPEGRMVCDLMRQRVHQNLQRDGTRKQEISSPSIITVIYLPPRSPNSPPSIDWEPICNGKTSSIIGRNPIQSSKAFYTPSQKSTF